MKYFGEKTEGLINFQDLKSTRVKIIYFVMFLFLVIIAAVCVLPVIWIFLSAFKTPEEMYRIPPTFFPETVSVSGISKVLTGVDFFKYFKNTLILVVGVWVSEITINGLCGYVLSRLKPKGTALIETMIFWAMLLPGVSMAPLYMTFVDMPLIHVNLSGTFWPMFMIAGCSAFNVMLFRNFFNNIPMDYIEAARIDGCSSLGIFFKIILPLAKPIIMVVSIFSIIGSWSNFFWPYLILGSTPNEPISVMLYQITNGAVVLKDNEVMMLTMLAILPPLVVYAFLSKKITGGVSMSGIKG